MDTILLVVLVVIDAAIVFILLGRKSVDASGMLADAIDRGNERITSVLRSEIAANRREMLMTESEGRRELAGTVKSFGDTVNERIFRLTEKQGEHFDRFSERIGEVVERNDFRMEKVREAVEKRLEDMRRDNGERLEKMRETVDEKLHATLERRLGDSFKLVSDRLDLVHKGLGEMQTLAVGVGDLKKVLQNVKTRGTWGEVQLGNLLDDILTPDQYDRNVATRKGSNDRVEFAIRIPAKDEKVETIWLPIDAKFPLEDYQGLIDASEKGDADAVDRLSKALEIRIKSEAKDIHDKYVDPPHTTDFGILFLPNEGLYAEVLRRPGLVDNLRRDCKVVVAGPTTVAALLSSLQVGFRALAIEKRSSEVWTVLGAVKKEFGAFGDILDKTHKKLQEASNTIENASRKSRTIERKLGKVQELPVPELVDETLKIT